MWNPRWAEASKPLRSPVTVTGPVLLACSKVTVPDTGESPARTTTAYRRVFNKRVEGVVHSVYLVDRRSVHWRRSAKQGVNNEQ